MIIKYNSKWRPVNEAGEYTDEDFDTRFSFDREYRYDTLLFKYRFRIVKHPNLGKNNYNLYINKITKFHLYFYIRDKYLFNNRFQNFLTIFNKFFFKYYEATISSNDLKKFYNYKIETIKTKRKYKLNSILNES